MSKSVLIGAIAACILAVAAIAVLTPTVIVSGGGGNRILRVGPASATGPGVPPLGPGGGLQVRPPKTIVPLPGAETCVQSVGPLRQGQAPLPGLSSPRRAFRVCTAQGSASPQPRR